MLAGDAWQRQPAQLGGRCFNPRPPLLAGDAHFFDPINKRLGCFNPRPPLLAGDANNFGAITPTTAVSIRARHCWRAMPFTYKALSAFNFSVHFREPGDDDM
ncbi:MAG: hypothetical protein AUK50_09295 [Comamonadaceae bacterium CG2_30_57_122]|nr:MAG: hypothetical protein AUK50_09295 [Comamonadaceae bacterium CG2_30_57_122]